MTRALRLSIPLLLLLLIPAWAVASSQHQVWVTNCTKEQYKPKTIFVACGDGSAFLRQLKWSRWSSSEARGRGRFTYNDCVPNCAASRPKSLAAKVKLSDPRTCPKQKHKVFNRALVTFTGKRPKGYKKNQRFTLGCPIKTGA